ncbi:MAG: Hsp20 family protein [Chthoniobacterales bacterium]|nr:Hsp20 family protein [Chthoniobacterales bacterium]
MKVQTNYRRAGVLAAGLAFGASCMMTSPLAIAASDEKTDNKGLVEKVEQWQDKMSEKFRDTWKNLRGESKNKAIATASVDLREDKDTYTIRLNLPDRDLEKVEIKLEGDTLHIVAPAGDKAGRYEQTLALANVDSAAKPKIERRQKDDLVVVTVPKHLSVTEASPTIPDPSLLPLSDWDSDILARMEKMRREMDRVFDDSWRNFPLTPEAKGFFDAPRFGSKVDLQTEGDNYVVRAYLPERDMKNVNVTVDGQTLKIEAKSEDTTRKEGEGATMTHKAEYSQLLTLPGPVHADKMKVDKKEGMLVVTLPKAESK